MFLSFSCWLSDQWFFLVVFLGGMASSEMPPLSIWQGVWIVPLDNNVTLEDIPLVVGEQVGHDNLSSALQTNKAVFLKDEAHCIS